MWIGITGSGEIYKVSLVKENDGQIEVNEFPINISNELDEYIFIDGVFAKITQ